MFSTVVSESMFNTQHHTTKKWNIFRFDMTQCELTSAASCSPQLHSARTSRPSVPMETAHSTKWTLSHAMGAKTHLEFKYWNNKGSDLYHSWEAICCWQGSLVVLQERSVLTQWRTKKAQQSNYFHEAKYPV